MAITRTGSITFEANGQEATCHFPYSANLSALGTFAAAIQPYSVAAVADYSYTETENDPAFTPASGEEALQFMAIIKMRKPAGQFGTQQISIPAPDPDIFDFIEGAGYRVKNDVGVAITAAYSALKGETYTFESGWLTS